MSNSSQDQGDASGSTPVPVAWDETYERMRQLARRFMGARRSSHTLQATALANEAYLRLQKHVGGPSDVRSLISLASYAMRSVLADHARRRAADKRGGSICRIPMDDTLACYEESAIDVIALDEALERLQAVDPRLTELINLRFFGGLSEEETAELLGLSVRTVRREWHLARAWLRQELSR